MFGAQSFVKYSARYEEVKGTLTRISSNGTFEKFDPSNEFNALKSLICLPSNPTLVEPSDNAEKILNNDDGSITIVRPKFSNPDGNGSMRLSGGESLFNRDGVCKLFGAHSFVLNSARYEEVISTLTRISSNGTFEKFDSGYKFDALKSLICIK